jgi:hypothetical protein
MKHGSRRGIRRKRLISHMEPIYCFGVRPGGIFVCRDQFASFYVVNEGSHLIRITAEILKESQHGSEELDRRRDQETGCIA